MITQVLATLLDKELCLDKIPLIGLRLDKHAEY
jgi:hypothetical protein